MIEKEMAVLADGFIPDPEYVMAIMRERGAPKDGSPLAIADNVLKAANSRKMYLYHPAPFKPQQNDSAPKP